MKITCEFCGAMIDTTQHTLCPNCNASIEKNKQFKEYQSYKMQFDKEMMQLEFKEQEKAVKRQAIENRKLQAEMSNKRKKTITKVVMGILLTPVISVFVFLIIGIIVAISYPQSNDADMVIEDTTLQEQYHDIVVGETASTAYYDLKVPEWSYYTPASYAIKKGEKYIKIQFEFTNTVDKKIIRDQSILCYDQNGASCKEQYSLLSEDENMDIKKQYVLPGQTYSAYAYFIVPENETQLTVHYGEYIKITIDLTKEVDQ